MNITKSYHGQRGQNKSVQIGLSIAVIVLLAVCFVSSDSLLAASGDYLQVLSPFEIQDTFGLAYLLPWVPIVLTVLFFAVVISNLLTGERAGLGTSILFYLSSITVTLSLYFKIASIALSYLAVTPLIGPSEIVDFMRYAILVMPLFIVVCLVVFCKLNASHDWIVKSSALSWCLFVAAMLILGAFAPAFIYLVCLGALWLIFCALTAGVLILGVFAAAIGLLFGFLGNSK